MRVNFVLPPVSLSGGIRVVAIYAERLQQRGHQVTLVSPPMPQPSVRERFRRLRQSGQWTSPRVRPSYLDDLEVDHRVLDRHRPVEADDLPDADVTIATWWETAEWVAALPAEKGVKVHFVQGHEVFPPQPVERVQRAYRLPLKKITISYWLVDVLKSEYGVRDVVRVPNGVDTTQFHAPPRSRQNRPTVGMLYKHHAVKGCDVSLAALEMVKRQLPDLHLVTFGVRAPSAPLTLPDWSEFHLSPAQDRIKDLYASCDVWLCGSRSEGFHLPPIEAMSCRCPVVSTRVGGPMDIVRDGENGYLVDIEDSEGLAKRLLQVLNLPEQQWRTMSDAAYATAMSYTWEGATDSFERALLDMVEAESEVMSAGKGMTPCR